MKKIMIKAQVVCLMALFPLLAAQAQGPARVGQPLTSQCAACHGVQGLSTLPNAPHLAGQPWQYLEEQLQLYRSGKRRHEIMNLLAKPLTDQQIQDIATWYSSIQIQIVVPPGS